MSNEDYWRRRPRKHTVTVGLQCNKYAVNTMTHSKCEMYASRWPRVNTHPLINYSCRRARGNARRAVIDLNSDLSCLHIPLFFFSPFPSVSLFRKSPRFAIKMQHSAADWLITCPTLYRTSRWDKSDLALFTLVYEPICYVMCVSLFRHVDVHDLGGISRFEIKTELNAATIISNKWHFLRI